MTVAAVPWARHGSRFTRAFEDLTAWLTTRIDKSAVCSLLRVAWRTVGRIIERVVEDKLDDATQLDGLRRIGIDEVSYKRRHHYLTVVVDHDTGRLVWASKGKDSATVQRFFDDLNDERIGELELISADASNIIQTVARDRAPQATVCLDPFHIVRWASEALDEVRRTLWRDLRKSGDKAQGLALQRSRFALWKNPENLTESQQAKLSSIARLNKPLYRAYLLKEQLREVFKTKGEQGKSILDGWLKWASRCRLQPFVELGRRIRRHRKGIEAALEHQLSNARVEAANTTIRLLTRIAFGFHSAAALIALAFLRLGDMCPALPHSR